MTQITSTSPTLCLLGGAFAFPGRTSRLCIGRDASIAAAQRAWNTSARTLVLAAEGDAQGKDDQRVGGPVGIGVLARIVRLEKVAFRNPHDDTAPAELFYLEAEGLHRVDLHELTDEEACLMARWTHAETSLDAAGEAVLDELLDTFAGFAPRPDSLPLADADSALAALQTAGSLERAIDEIVNFPAFVFDLEFVHALLLERDVIARAALLKPALQRVLNEYRADAAAMTLQALYASTPGAYAGLPASDENEFRLTLLFWQDDPEGSIVLMSAGLHEEAEALGYALFDGDLDDELETAIGRRNAIVPGPPLETHRSWVFSTYGSLVDNKLGNAPWLRNVLEFARRRLLPARRLSGDDEHA